MASRRVLAVIPARLASQRLPQKPLKDIHGKTLVQRVYERAGTAKTVSRVVVATDSPEIERVARSFGAEVMMTDSAINTGSGRVAATYRILATQGERFDVVVNVQGDMPFISGELIDRTVRFLLEDDGRFAAATVATPILDEATFKSASDVKVVVTSRGRALYFSRAPVPHSRDGDRLSSHGQTVFGYKHFGLYVFRPEMLAVFEDEPISALEAVEKLEQLRLLELGHNIGVCIVEPELTRGSVEVDTAEDLARSVELARMLEG